MGAFEDFLKRRGFVKLDHYGLVLTPDDRVLSTRPAVLDDGLGGKIVGWVDGDLAAAELDHWGTSKRAPAKPLAVDAGLQSKLSKAPVSEPRPAQPKPAPAPASVPEAFAPTVQQVARPLPGMTPARIVAPIAAPAPAPKPVLAVGSAPVVAAEPVVEEDEWEWEIAMARARAVADDVQVAAASIASNFRAPAAPKNVAPKNTMPMLPIMAKPDPLNWPETEPFGENWERTRESPALQLPVAKPVVATSTRSTVIPVPTLPVAARPSDVRPVPYTPRATSRMPAMSAPRTRMARGTGREDTVQTAAVLPANEDRTSPYVTLPEEVRPTGYAHAHTKRVAAKHR